MPVPELQPQARIKPFGQFCAGKKIARVCSGSSGWNCPTREDPSDRRLNDETTQAMSRTLVGDDQNYEYKGPSCAPCRGPGSSAKSVWSYSDFADLASEPAFAVNAR